MQRVAQVCQVPMVRTGVGRQTAIVIVGVLSVSTLLRKVKRRRRKNAQADHRRVAAAHRMEVEASDAVRDWASEASSIQPASVGEGEQLLLDECLPVTPKQLWKLIYNLSFIQRFYQRRGYRDIGIGGWQKTGENVCSKTAHYITPVKKNVLGPKEAYTEEESICSRRHAGGFIVKTCAYTRKVPYGGSFHVELIWTATRLTAATTRLQVVGIFVPEKRMLGVGGIIRKATKEGLEENYKQYREYLLESIATAQQGSGQASAGKAQIAASRTASAIRKEAAEDLVRNGVFVSWAQLIWALLVFICIVAAARLAMSRDVRSNAAQSWKAEWQRASAYLLARQ